MSYKAKGSGLFYIKKDTPGSLIHTTVFDFFDHVALNPGKTISGEDALGVKVMQDGKFCSEDAFYALRALDSYTLSGVINMINEFGSIWRYRFSEEMGTWLAESGRIVYEEGTRDGSCPSFTVPAYAVMKKTIQSEFTEPRYYASIRGTSEIVEFFMTEEDAGH